MALKEKSPGRWWARAHFLIRFAGLAGLMAAAVGVMLAYLQDILSRVVDTDVLTSAQKAGAWWDFVLEHVTGKSGTRLEQWAVGLLAGGVLLVVIALLVELCVILFSVTARRSAFGVNAAVQVGLAVVLVVGINLYSFGHYLRMDWTRLKRFTLDPDIQHQLSQLKGETTIVVFPRQKKVDLAVDDRPDPYDRPAARKVIEKVEDLAEQFHEFGPQFHVHMLDVDEEGYDKKRERLTGSIKGLQQALDSAPDSSIFFCADGKIQRLSFDEFYKLDKAASRQADDGRGNLVLLYQGEKPFADKVLNIDAKRPKVGILVIHEWLTTQGPEDYGFAGLKKSLEARGFDVRDVLLKKWSEMAGPEPAVYTYDENKFEDLEEQLAEMDANIKSFEQDIKEITEVIKLWSTASVDELTKKYAKQLEQSKTKKVTEEMRRNQLEHFKQELEPQIAFRRMVLKQLREEQAGALKEKSTLNVEGLAEQRRITDLKAKLERSLADCDMLLVPRMTIRNLVAGDRIPNRLYRLDEAQVAAIKDFLKAGKPILACFGPANESPSDAMQMARMGPAGPDEVENLFGELGIKFGKQTVLFNAESKAFAEKRSGFLTTGVNVEVPPVEFERLPPTTKVLGETEAVPFKPNPIKESMQISTHSRGEKALDLRVRYPRPVYFDPEKRRKLNTEPEFMITDPASWNEDQPFPTRDHTPRFEPPKADDPNKDTPEEKRRGPFSIGVAVQTRVPAEWYADKPVEPKTVRVAAIGTGSVFSGTNLSLGKEELLLNTCNWLLGRDELLPTAEHVWTFPRVKLEPKTKVVWYLGTCWFLPGVFFCLGLMVIMVRQLR